MYNLTTYPNLVGLLEQLEVDTQPSDMSFAVSMDGGAFEWGSRGLGALFAQRANLASPRFWRMVWDVLRFNRQAPQVHAAADATSCCRWSGGWLACRSCVRRRMPCRTHCCRC